MNKLTPHIVLALGAILVALIIRDGMIRSADAKAEVQVASAMETQSPKTLNQFEVIAPPGSAAALEKRSDGYYWAEARVNNASYVDFMVDTGASICVLTTDDAQRLGLDWRSLDKDLRISTAGGTVMGASVMLDEVEIGGVLLRDVSAVILEDHLDQSLLGMSFMKRLSSWQVTPKAIIINQ